MSQSWVPVLVCCLDPACITLSHLINQQSLTKIFPCDHFQSTFCQWFSDQNNQLQFLDSFEIQHIHKPN